ncbi:hypothetical protein N0Y54_26915 [Nostoc punctiforme UO1]|uniref:hypothetical protein n=1 Tax=Nostoc punctiforme TaxID=272131 RepID=UPI00309C5AE2
MTEAVYGRARFRYGWKKQVKSSSLLTSASCLLPCFLKAPHWRRSPPVTDVEKLL